MKLAGSSVRPLVAELGMLVIGSAIGGFKTIMLFDFSLSRKVFQAKGG
jgi:hypothetical protein